MIKILRIVVFSLVLLGCKKNVQYLESDKDKEARYVITTHKDSIFIAYTRYGNNPNNSNPLIRQGNDYWNPEDKVKKDENGFVPLSEKIFRPFIFLSLNKHGTLLEDELSLINDSILTYQKGGKYITEIKSNNKPVSFYYFYDRDFHIDSIILIRLKDTIVYKQR